jgi:hypothetical protein
LRFRCLVAKARNLEGPFDAGSVFSGLMLNRVDEIKSDFILNPEARFFIDGALFQINRRIMAGVLFWKFPQCIITC